MNYEQKYHEALERANEAVKRGMVSQNFVDDIFGVESEDERIRKEIISLVLKVMGQEKNNLSDDKYDAMLSWLEKKKEKTQKLTPIDLTEMLVPNRYNEQKPLSTEETELNSIAFLEQLGYTCVHPEKEQKPAEWSEEDKKWIAYFERLLEFAYNKDPRDLGSCCVAGKMWLKSLRPEPKGKWEKRLEEAQARWKPSEEQIEYLAKAIDTLDEEGDCKTAAVLNELRCDLKKLLK